ncbi:tRNA (cytosine(32)/uridine(32)-2'-O)-methyltransferase TrmJ [Paraferrimonas sp. SM1919]|uniref:tRNA (cytosine(32)/uridine(32)-2'-O)-methyltransferase TrmJ n=1 Tax=Paraferrimonas sp. SM1919 TaxID=2662263 RepID=UPI0013D02E88|nr:tRNA (cytosine(32)/uridine(32)-2'-O)-methyltransferase TrmJ [Paraferrimonas sp. SM1919]
MLDQIKVILVGTTHSGNIGSAARAMKTMGLSNLVLVQPKAEIDGKSIALAAGASDILKNTQIVDSLEQAISDCQLVMACSARNRTLDWPVLTPRESGRQTMAEAAKGKVAIIFGRESNGLSNEELQLANYHVCIEANPEYSSLNLAQAVQILCYEMRCAYLETVDKPVVESEVDYVDSEGMERFYTHLEQSLLKTGFIVKAHPGQVMNKLRRLFNRIRVEAPEMNILRGILSSIDRTARGQTRVDK